MGLQGYRLTIFLQEQAGPKKQYDWEPLPKLRGPALASELENSNKQCKINVIGNILF